MKNICKRLILASALTLAGASAMAQGVPPPMNGAPPPVNRAPAPLAHTPGAAPDIQFDRHDAVAPPPKHFKGPEGRRAEHRRPPHPRHEPHFRPSPEIHRLKAQIVESAIQLQAAEDANDQAAILAMKHRLRKDTAALKAARHEQFKKHRADFGGHEEPRFEGSPPHFPKERPHGQPPRDGVDLHGLQDFKDGPPPGPSH